VEQCYRQGSALDFPKRPEWSYGETKEQVLEKEERSFKEYLFRLRQSFAEDELSYFELNLETWRQLWRVLEVSDILFIIVDIRYAPLHFSPALFDYVTKELGRKVLIILNKCDLVGEPTTTAWKEYFIKTFPGVYVVTFTSFPSPARSPHHHRCLRRLGRGLCIAANMSEQQLLQRESEQGLNAADRDWLDANFPSKSAAATDGKLAAAAKASKADASKDCPTRPELVERDTNFITIGMIGQPNVGKSTIINSLVKRPVVSTSQTPGHTKHFQTNFLSSHIRLCDCPGLIFPSLVPRPLQASFIVAGQYPVAQVRDPYTPIGFVAERIDLVNMLKIKHPELMDVKGKNEERKAPEWTPWDICEAWAYARQYFTAKAARPDVYRAANDLLRHAVEGRIVLSIKPPGYFDRYGTDVVDQHQNLGTITAHTLLCCE
ncbi:uncharacterized protein MONBRDRAFT_16766, partial [Monosiga brevicollis MX1]